ncbi:MAG: type II toxin-antitoxin system VapC family toxin, partial [Calditrichaeota bacterium]|nr:type II toxin-antitoxin system VapC family toxin [Calditrichota bacterium]
SIGKLNFQGIGIDDIPFGIKENGFKILDLNENEALLFFKLKSVLNHKDPFDRLLIWQCIQNKYHFLTRDSHIAFYEDQGLQVANI